MRGEFVGADGQIWKSSNGVYVHTSDGESVRYLLPSTHPDFPAAVAALQSLLPKPKPVLPLDGVSPAVGLRYCGEEDTLCEGCAGCLTEAGVSAPLTLAEVREMQDDFREERGTDEQLKLCATIEWLVKRLETAMCDEVPEECEDDCRRCLDASDAIYAWLRGEA